MEQEVIDPCIHCGCSTAFGSGRFVNRIPGDTDDGYGGVYRTGFACEECRLMECEVCGELSAEAGSSDLTPFRHICDLVCDDCVVAAGGWDE